MLSEEEIDDKMVRLADEYMKREIENATWDNAENLSLVFTYKKTANLVKLSENLAKHSERLTRWTIVIGISTILLFISAVIQLIKLCST